MPRNDLFRPVRETIRAAKNDEAVKDFSVPTNDDRFGMLFIFREYEYQRPGGSVENRGRFASIDTSNSKTTVFLPLPENINDNFDVRVQRFDQGTIGAIAAEVLSSTTSGGLNVSNLQEATINALIKALPQSLSSGDEAYKTLTEGLKSIFRVPGADTSVIDRLSADAAFLLRKILPGNVGRVIDAGTGTFINPKAALSFEGVEMKNHNFNWTIAPKSETESENLRKIIREIKKNMLPQYVTGEITQRALLRYPSMVDIFFVGLDQNFYYFFKTAMIRSFNINYTPNGVSVLKGGKPAAVQMQMSVIEADIHTAEDHGAESFNLAGAPRETSRDTGSE
jgi:hypothetical protein